MASEECTSVPVVKKRPFIPDAVTVAVLPGSPISTLPWNWAPPAIFTLVASGKFHSRRSRSLLIGSVSPGSPVKVLIVLAAPTMLTRIVAPAGMPSNSMPCIPPLAAVTSKSTVNTCNADFPSPVNRVRYPSLRAVPVAGRGVVPSRA
ncbi:hypothetical protein BKN51_14705 [Amycolatopsis sp. BJA-103]|nr:hypothetical protein BKN51_14705 [Amycolatopsis sp. BJA-103]